MALLTPCRIHQPPPGLFPDPSFPRISAALVIGATFCSEYRAGLGHVEATNGDEDVPLVLEL